MTRGPLRSRTSPGHRVAYVLIVVSLGVLATMSTPAGSAEPAISLVGTLQYPEFEITNGTTNFVVGVRPDGAEVYSVVDGTPAGSGIKGRYLFAHLLRPDGIGAARRAATPTAFNGSISPLKASIDTSSQRLTLLGIDIITSEAVILQYDTQTLDAVRTVAVPTLVPGFHAMGLTHVAEDDRFYLVGEFSGAQAADALSKAYGRPAGPIPAIVSLHSATLAPAWVHPLTDCPQVLDSFTAGALIARSADRPVLYTFCIGTGVLGAVGTGQPTVAGVLRLYFDPAADMTDTGTFRTQYFPVSGVYTGGNPAETGAAGFDPVSERLFVQSLSFSQPGGWVFDGRSDAWVGFVAGLDNSGQFLGVNPANGRYYIGASRAGQGGWINVTDGRSTPIAQGLRVDGPMPGGFLVPDPTSNRVFVATSVAREDLPFPDSVPSLLVDRSEAIVPLTHVDLDSHTVDMPDDKVRFEFSASIGGYGVRYDLVGGVEGGLSGGGAISEQAYAASGLALGDRGLTLAEIPRVDVRPAGAAGTARIATVDDSTGSDLADADSQTGGTGTAASPYRTVSCLDGDGTRLEESEVAGNGTGSATVICDLAHELATAEASFHDPVVVDDVEVSRARYEASLRRVGGVGASTETTAIAEGVRLGEVTIDRVAATATTVANGRPGSAIVKYTRSFDGVNLGDGSGPFSCTMEYASGQAAVEDGSCRDLAQRINARTQGRVEVRFPEPQLDATPGGAFSAVTETEPDFLNGLTVNNDDDRFLSAMEAIVYNDSREKSRLLVQFAAIESTSILTRTALSVPGPHPQEAHTEPGSGPSGAAGEAPATDTLPALGDQPAAVGPVVLADPRIPPEPETAGPVPSDDFSVALPPVTGPVGWLVGTRGLGDVAAAGGLWVLFAGPLLAGMRRRRLLATTVKGIS
jgi:hypothetical protein